MKQLKQALLALLLIWISAGSAGGQSKINFTEFNLNNGLHVILHQDNTTPIVAVTISYHVGSKNENPERTGFTHFFEHLMFEGSENIARGEFDRIAMNAGAQLNANTSFDRTFYYLLLPSNQLELGLWMESERLLHLRVDSIGVETQRNVIIEEKKQTYDNRPYGKLLPSVMERAYTVHPYRWTPIGSDESLRKATLAEFRDFHSIFYVPNNATLSIAGDINVEETRALVEKYFGDIPRGKKTIYRPNITEPVKTRQLRDTVYDNIQIPAVIHSYHIPAQGTPDYYALGMLTKLLSQGQSSRMNKAIVDKQQIALGVQAIPLALEDPGLFIVFGIANMGVNPADLDKSIVAEIERVRKEEITDKEFEKLRNMVENEFYSKNSTMAGIAESLSDYHMYFGDANLINTEMERYMKVTKADIRRVANQYLIPENSLVLYYLPQK